MRINLRQKYEVWTHCPKEHDYTLNENRSERANDSSLHDYALNDERRKSPILLWSRYVITRQSVLFKSTKKGCCSEKLCLLLLLIFVCVFRIGDKISSVDISSVFVFLFVYSFSLYMQ